MPKPEFTIEAIQSLTEIDSDEWNLLVRDNNPFSCYEFLSALESNHCLDNSGWHSHHFIAKDNHNKLIAAVPGYLKTNSYGEFVFDWSWASAYEQAGLSYYPKLVLAIPFTPASGQRILTDPNHADIKLIKNALVNAITDFAKGNNISSVHCLFPNDDDCEFFMQHQWLCRSDYQFHWQNYNYPSFDHFIENFKSRKRKKTKRERQSAIEHEIQFTIKDGTEMSNQDWQEAYHFYHTTFSKKLNHAALSLDFFKTLTKKMPSQLIIIFAQKDSINIAASIFFKSDTTLYGRYWGCSQNINHLHFETCFYQGIDYCIKNKLTYFEPGAQGEHKITRGFLPVKTQSVHWLADERFRIAIKDFLDREACLLSKYKLDLDKLSPFKTPL